MFREGRQFEKNRRSCEKTRLFFHRFFIENRRKIQQKSRKTAFATKIDKKAFLGAPVFAKSRFFVDFWVPDGSQNRSKIEAKKDSKKRLLGPNWPQWAATASHREKLCIYLGI